MSENFRYDGNSDSRGATWRGDVLNYFVSRCPDSEPWLIWAEQRGAEKITPKMIEDAKTTNQTMTEAVGAACPHVISHHIWGFFQHCLTGAAKQVFKTSDRRDGLNIWRRLVLEINSKTDCRRHALRNKCQQPAQVQSLKQVRCRPHGVGAHLQRVPRRGRRRDELRGPERPAPENPTPRRPQRGLPADQRLQQHRRHP